MEYPSFRFKVNLDLDRLAGRFASGDWVIKKDVDIFYVEDGRRINYWVLVILIVLGFFLIVLGYLGFFNVMFLFAWFFSFWAGIGFWVSALIYVLICAFVVSPHRAVIAKVSRASRLYEYRASPNTRKAFNYIISLCVNLGAEIDVDGMYHALLDRYRRIYGTRTYRSILEDEINTLKAEGLSREEAVKKIFQKRIDLFKQ